MSVAEDFAPSRVKSIALWAVKGLLALAFLSAGLAKFYGFPMLVEEFEKIGLGEGFRYITATLEIAGALTILQPTASVFGAMLLCCIMLGAIISHIFIIGGSPIPAVVLLLLSAVVAFAESGRLRALIGSDVR
ncbi:MAG: DoxX family protein [Bradyrhizobium sp. 35-63-5]|nr:MAG: DoxX family protein [Bradyrhizobium sp. 35-63-5]